MKTRNLVLTAIFAALTIVFAQITIPLPFTPIPFTLSVLAVFLTGALLPKQYALYAQLVYLLLGICGLPVFGGFSGGIGRMLGPTGGYLVAFPLMAFLTAWIPELLHRKTVVTLAVGMLASLILCYLLGSLWYTVVGNVSWAKSLLLTVVPFIPMDLVKLVISAVFGVALGKALGKAKLAPEA